MGITGAIDDFSYHSDTFYYPDGAKISKRNISNILTSKFKALPCRTTKSRGIEINKKDIEKIYKQYEVVDEIIVSEPEKNDNESLNHDSAEQPMTHDTYDTF